MRRDPGALEAREHDLLVIGGGITGAAVAWEAARRGLAVALVEADDFGSGASWNSLKTIHGGLRHLQRGHLGALRESARDRAEWLRLAPSLVRPLPFLVPARGHGPRGREVLAAGVFAAHALGADLGGDPPRPHLPPPRVLSPAQVREHVPGIDTRGLSGGVVWHDAQVESSERLVLALLHAAADAGAALANHVRAEALEVDGGRIAGATVHDLAGGGRVRVRARAVVNTAGAGLDPLLDARGLRAAETPRLVAWNLVLRRPVVRGLAVGAEAGGRFLFLVPWRDRAMVGTAYAPPGADAAGARRSLLRDAQAAFPWAAIEEADVALVHEGLVPGSGSAAGLVSVSRLVDHAAEGAPGLWTVVAAKFTTALSSARQAVDAVVESRGGPTPGRPAAAVPLPKAGPLEGPLAERTRVAVRDEMAVTLCDAVLRRLDLGSGGPPDRRDTDAVAGAMGEDLGWDGPRAAGEREALAGFFAARRIH